MQKRGPHPLLAFSSALMLAFLSTPRVAAQGVPSATVVDGFTIKTVKHASGTFHQDNTSKKWIEEGRQGQQNTFAEEKRDKMSIILYDAGRDTRLRIDLQKRQILLAEGRRLSPLYDIVSFSTAAKPAPRAASAPKAAASTGSGVSGLTLKTATYAGGLFRQDGPNQWIEENEKGPSHAFVEEKRDATSVTVLEPRSSKRVLIDLKKQQMFISSKEASYTPLYAIKTASATVTPPRTAEQRCHEAIQGKVAWNRQGNKSWAPKDLKQLCSTTTLIAKTIECFEGAIKAHGDTQRAIRACTIDRHRVQAVYVIPKGQQPRPDAEKAIEAAMAVVQRHYFQQLGVTFQLTQPVVTTVHIADDAEKVKEAVHAHAVSLAQKDFKSEYEYQENVIIAIFEGVVSGTAHGGQNVTSIPNNFWKPIYETFKRSPAELPAASILHGWSHEIGHSLGLMHTEDTKNCLSRFGVNLGELPSLIMQKKENLPTVYDYPFMPQENRLLLEESYYPACRPLVAGRPHARWHLQHRLPQ